MKKSRLIWLMPFFILLYFIQMSCQHTVPITCEDVNFQIEATSTNANGSNPDGTITVTATGGNGFSFNLNGGPTNVSGSFSGLPSGLYTIIGHNDLGCADTIQVVISATDPCAGLNISINYTKVDATLGQSNGSINATASPSGNYTYSIDGNNFQAVGVFPNLPAGNYTITAKNQDGCTGTQSVNIGSIDPCSGVTITVSTTQVNPTTGQNNGSITATASPAGTYTYNLNGGSYQSSGTFSNLSAGSYTVTAKNSIGCTSAPRSVTLGATDPCAGVTITVTTSQTNPTTGQSNGSITATASPAGTYTYSINGGAFQSSSTFNSLGAGTYTVTAKNSNGCLGSRQVTLTTTNPCAGINITFSGAVVNVLPCPSTNGSITITASGSTGFTYNKNGGAYQASNIFSNLTAGNYTIGVKDANGCTASQVIIVGTQAMGPNFTNVRTIIHSKCVNCHLNGQNDGGYNFDSDCSIVTKWSQIKGACVQPYTLRQMPPSTPLTATQQSQITTWVNDGHRYTD